jgi:hypothetical protein
MTKATKAIDDVLDALSEAVKRGDHEAAEAYARVLSHLRDIALMHV